MKLLQTQCLRVVGQRKCLCKTGSHLQWRAGLAQRGGDGTEAGTRASQPVLMCRMQSLLAALAVQRLEVVLSHLTHRRILLSKRTCCQGQWWLMSPEMLCTTQDNVMLWV